MFLSIALVASLEWLERTRGLYSTQIVLIHVKCQRDFTLRSPSLHKKQNQQSFDGVLFPEHGILLRFVVSLHFDSPYFCFLTPSSILPTFAFVT